MAIDKLIPQYLSSDTDQKLVKSVEMTDNLNVRVSNNAEGTAGVIKNIKGTEALSPKTPADAFPAGDNRVIGSVDNDKNKEVLFFLWNSNGNHGIYRIDTKFDTYQKVYEDSVLGFNKLHHVDCDVVVNDKEQTLLYWTDNVNPPMKINVNRALDNDYPASLTSGTDDEKLLNLTVAKQPPLKAPTYNIVNNPSLGFSKIRDKNFQFAYRYKYTDGEVSSLSPYSTISVSEVQYRYDFVSSSSKDFYNQIDVYVQNSTADVKEIQLYARESNSSPFFEVEKIQNTNNNNFVTVSFTNNKKSSFLSKDDENKIYDNVPQKARALSVSNNRLFLGNYVEGYENIDTDVEFEPVYHAEPETYEIKTKHNGTTDLVIEEAESNASNSVSFDIDFSDIPSNINANSVVNISFVIIPDVIRIEEKGTWGTFGQIDFEFINPETETIEKASSDVGSLSFVRVSPQGIVVSKRFEFPNGTTRADLISEVTSYLSNASFPSIIDPNSKKEKYKSYDTVAGISGSESNLWYSGYAEFKAANITTSSNILTFDLKFAGAALHVKFAEIQGGSWWSSAWSAVKPVEVISSDTIEIGGETGYNIYPDANESNPVKYYDYAITSNSSYVAELNGMKSYKSDSRHSFGIVYLDDRGRAGAVNELSDVFVKPVSNRQRTGGASVEMRVKHTAPSWANKWIPVYAGNVEYESFVQYSCSKAIANLNSSKVEGSPLSKKIFVSMATLEGQESSYKEQTGANIEYKFEEGDVLKILKYKDSSGSYVYPSGHEYKVVDYKYIDEETASKFLVQKGVDPNPNGWYLILESEDYDGFTFEEVASNKSLWENNVIVEIMTPKKEIDKKVYHPIGKTYDVVNGEHYGDRNETVLSGGFTISIVNVSGAYGIASSSDRYFTNDEVDLGNGIIITITEVIPYYNSFIYWFSWKGLTPPSVASYATTTITNYTPVVYLNQGDTYFKPRRIRSNDFYSAENLPEKLREGMFSYSVDYVEDYSVSDFYSSNSISKGKPYAPLEDSRTIRRKSSVTYSDAYVLDSDRLNLSSFNLSLANWSDLNISYGAINKLVSRGDAITVLQESKSSQVPTGRNLIEYSNGDANATVSKNVLGIASYYAGNYGTSNPESVVERFGVVYFTDLNSRKVIRLSADGITPISDKGMDSYFQKLLEELDKNVSVPKIVGGFDPDNGEYILTVEDFSQSTIVVQSSDPELEPNVYEVEVTEDGNYEPTPTYTSTQIIWNTIPFNWNEICQEWDEVGNGYLEVDGVFYIDSLLQGSTGVVTILVTDAANTFVAVAQYDLGTGIVTIPAQTCDGRNMTTNFGGAESSGVTISYKHKEGVWSSKYSFLPSNYASIGNVMYSFFQNDNGLAWKHNVNETRNLIYGEQYSSMFEVVSNYNPSMIKVYQSLGIEGNGNWTSIIENSRQETQITEFDEREGNRYAMIPRDTINSTSHQIYLGVVESVNGNKVTFSTPINKLPFVIGDYLKTAVGNTLSTTGVSIVSLEDRKTIVCSGIGVNVGENVFVEHSSIIDGDPMRDVYASIKLTSNDTEPFEVHAVSVHYDRSMLHNERVN